MTSPGVGGTLQADRVVERAREIQQAGEQDHQDDGGDGELNQRLAALRHGCPSSGSAGRRIQKSGLPRVLDVDFSGTAGPTRAL